MKRCKISPQSKREDRVKQCRQTTSLLLAMWSGCIDASTNSENSQHYCHSVVCPSDWTSPLRRLSACATTWLLGYGQHMPCQTASRALHVHVRLHLPMQTQCLPPQYSCLFPSHCVCGVRSCHWRLQTNLIEGCGSWK